MIIKTITFTGADDSILPDELFNIAAEAKDARGVNVEWGILLSEKQVGTPRFPSLDWLMELVRIWLDASGEGGGHYLHLSGHLCGRWLRELMMGELAIPRDYWPFLNCLERIQLNFHGGSVRHITAPAAGLMKGLHKDIIFQVGSGSGDLLYREFLSYGVNAFPFFDISNGAGMLPDQWPTPLDMRFSGYAGGLGPDNLDDQLKRIEDAVGGREIWIDMETKVRSDDNMRFDVHKVEDCIRIAEKWAA